MDNLAHTLVGASLAEAGLKRLTPLATTTLIVAANLPDVDGACYVVGSDLALGFRRGWTHGIGALALWPIALTALMVVLDRVRRRADRPPAKSRALLALSVLGVLSHPALDWLNTYGIRLLMPFDGRWFYGDALFIVDPWLWLLAASAVVAGRAWTRLAIAGWSLLGFLTTLIVVGNDAPSAGVTFAWLAGVAAIGAVGWTLRQPRQVEWLARITLGCAAVYIVAMAAGSRVARAQARAWFDARGYVVSDLMAGPVQGRPLARDIVAVIDLDGHPGYAFATLDWRDPELLRPAGTLVRGGPTPVTDAALRAPHVQGMRAWLRFPAFTTEALATGGFRVSIRDVRYARGRPSRGRGFARAEVELDAQLRPVPQGTPGDLRPSRRP